MDDFLTWEATAVRSTVAAAPVQYSLHSSLPRLLFGTSFLRR
jgi:hypothetical protein